MAAEDLVTVLARDLRNHLSPLQARLQILRRRAAREDHAANLSDTAKLLEELERLGRLISELLDIARLDQGLFTLSPQPVDIAVLAREIAQDMSSPAAAVRVAAPPELAVLADPVRLRQALENLVTNATDHARGGTEIALGVQAEERLDEGWAVITVTNDALGIPPDMLPRVFDRFAKGPGSAGLGLSLHLAQQIVVAHGGTLEVNSAPGSGTTFRLSIPSTARRR
jgi:two-component system, OmpR family, sensor kinase